MTDQSQDRGPAMASPPAHQLYTSFPLPGDSQCIRLLDIAAKKSAAEQGLTGTLRIVNLGDSPKFAALSYVWGESSGKSITCNGYQVNVTDSCFEALSALRDTLGSVTMWVDAVCIDQMDDDEKAAQIPLMGEIYTWAETVYIWLGPGTKTTKEGISFVRSVTRFRTFPICMPWRSRNRSMTVFLEQIRLFLQIFLVLFFVNIWHTESNSSLRRDFVERRLFRDRTSFLKLANQAWLQRSWTFQEIALSSNPVLVFGRDQVSWLKWHQALLWLPHTCVLSYADSYDKDLVADVETGFREHSSNWVSLFNIWQSLPRPCCWNGVRFRNVLGTIGTLRDDCSAVEYFRILHLRRIQTFARYCAIALLGAILFKVPVVQSLMQYWYEYRRELLLFLYQGVDKLGYLTCSFLGSCPHSWDISRCMGYPKGSEQRNHLVGLVRALRERQCSVEKDRVFAVGAVFKRLSIPQPTPDYKRSTGDIYRDAFSSLVEWDPSFISLLIDTGSRLLGAPSWVPDWGCVSEKGWLPTSYIYDAVQAPRWSREELPMSISGSTLSLQAAFLGVATHVTVPFRIVEPDCMGDAMPVMKKNLEHNAQEILEWLMRAGGARLVGTNYDLYDFPLAVLSVLHGHCVTIRNSDLSIPWGFLRVCRIVREPLIAGRRKELKEITDIVPATQATLKDMADESPFLRFVMEACNRLVGKRGLFISSCGRLGSGPASMLAGDQIALVKGVAAPLILRQQRDAYTVVGPCFIDVFMDLDAKALGNMNLDWNQVDLV